MGEVNTGSWDVESHLDKIVAAKEELRVNPQKAIDTFEHYAKLGSVKSMLLLADTYMRGRDVQRDLAKAAFWYDKVGENGLLFGTHMAADMLFRSGHYSEARSGFEYAAKRGFVPSVYRTAHMLAKGLGGAKNLEQAECLLKKASSAGHHGASIYYGYSMLIGEYGFSKILTGV